MSNLDSNLKAAAREDLESIEPPTESLSGRTARGFVWMAGQSITTKVITTAGQIVLAWFLALEDFGLAAVAYMFSVLPVLLQQGGVREVLIRRHAQFHEWANAAFWMSMTLGIAAGILMAGVAPFAAQWYGEPKLMGLILIVAVLFPLDSLSIVPMASLYGHMRFRLLASVLFGQAVIQAALMVLFAAWGFGAYSLILPRPIVAVLLAIVLWSVAPVRLHWRLELGKWRALFGTGWLVILANGCDLAMQYSPYLILSVITGFEAAGVYFFAFNLSVQAQSLITQNVLGVLFPALNQLHAEPQRQATAFLRAIRTLACVMIPACLVQAALSDPAVRIVFQPKWDPAIPVLIVLSIAMALKGTTGPVTALFQAQNRFGTRALLTGISAVVFGAVALAGAWWLGPLGVAGAVLAHGLVLEPVTLYVAVRVGQKSTSDLVRALGAPILLGVLTSGPAWMAAELIPDGTYRTWIQVAVITSISAVLYFSLARLMVPDAWDEVRQRAFEFMCRKR